MGQIYFLIFWIPAIASALCLRIAWGGGILRRPVLLLVWFGLALVLQIVSMKLSPGWAIGLALQAILAVYLVIRIKLDM